MPTNQPRDRQWELLVTDLRGCEDEQHQEWGDIDEVLISRYLAGECDEQERELVEQAARSWPAVRESIDLAKEVFADSQTVALNDKPMARASSVLVPASSGPARRSIFRRAGRAVFQGTVPNWLAAACLLVAVGLGWFLMNRMNDLRTQVAALPSATHDSPAGAAKADVESLKRQLTALNTRLDEMAQEPLPVTQAEVGSPGLQSKVQDMFDEISEVRKQLAQLAERTGSPDIRHVMRPIFETDSGPSDRQVAMAVRGHSGIVRSVPVQVCRYVAEERVRRVPHEVRRMVSEERVDETGRRYTVSRPVAQTSEREERCTVLRPVFKTRTREEEVQSLPDDVSDEPPVLSAEELLPAVSHSEELVRWAAADALTRVATGELKTRARVAIVETLEKKDASGQAAADYVLTGRIAQGFGEDLSEAAVDALGRSDKVVRWAGLHYFLVVRRCFEDEGRTVASPTFFESEFIARLIRQLVGIVRQEDADAVIRKAAIYLLGQFGNDAKPATGDLIQIVTTDQDPQARRWAAYALGQIGADASSAVSHLAEILLSRASRSDQLADAVVFPAVAYAFGELCGGSRESTRVKEVVPVLIESLKDPNPNISHWAAFALWRINGSASSTFAPTTSEPDTDSPPGTMTRPLVPIPRNDSPSSSTPGPRLVLPGEHTTARPTPQEGDLERPALTPPRASSLPKDIDTGGWRPARD